MLNTQKNQKKLLIKQLDDNKLYDQETFLQKVQFENALQERDSKKNMEEEFRKT